VVITATTDFQRSAKCSYRILLPINLHKGVLHLRSLAKYAAAFFRISFSSRKRRFSSSRRAVSDCSLFFGRPRLLLATSPVAFSWSRHLYNWLRRIPSSKAISYAGLSASLRSRTASNLKAFG